MGFWNSFKNQLGRNTGWVVSNWIYGDKAAHRYKGTVTYKQDKAKEAMVAPGVRVIEKEEDSLIIKDIKHVKKLKEANSKQELLSQLEQVSTIALSADKEASEYEGLLAGCIEKLEYGVMRLDSMDATKEVAYFQKKITVIKVVQENHAKNEKKTNMLMWIGFGVALLVSAFFWKWVGHLFAKWF